MIGTPQNDPLLSVTDLRQRAGQQTILAEVNFSVNAGERVGIFGLRASGKTTLLHILAGVESFTSGEVCVLGNRLPREQEFKHHTGLVTQKPSLFQDLRAGENLDYISVLKNHKLKDLEPIIERLALEEHLKKPLRQLDYGVLQRLSLACALIGDPALLLADELFNDINLYSRKLILNELRIFQERGGTCIWTYSDIMLSTHMDRILWLEEGRVVSVGVEAALQRWYDETTYWGIEQG